MEQSNTLLKGRVTQLQVLKYFLQSGYIVSSPEIPYQYDFLLDTGEKILKIQVKTCREVDEGSCIEFNTSSTTHNASGYKRRNYSTSTVDYFCTMYKNKCYLIPFSECGVKSKKLRLVPTKNGQIKNICFAKDYLAQEVLNNNQQK